MGIEERMQVLRSRADLPDLAYTHVSNGGSLTELAKTFEVPYGKLMRMLRANPDTSKLIDLALKDRDEWAKEKILSELRAIGLADARQCFDDDGCVLPVSKWPDVLAANVSALEVTEELDKSGSKIGYTKRIKFHDKLKALDMLAKQLKLIDDKTPLESLGKKLEDLLSESRALPEPEGTTE